MRLTRQLPVGEAQKDELARLELNWALPWFQHQLGHLRAEPVDRPHQIAMTPNQQSSQQRAIEIGEETCSEENEQLDPECQGETAEARVEQDVQPPDDEADPNQPVEQ